VAWCQLRDIRTGIEVMTVNHMLGKASAWMTELGYINYFFRFYFADSKLHSTVYGRKQQRIFRVK
jgi:hypothetical protein